MAGIVDPFAASPTGVVDPFLTPEATPAPPQSRGSLAEIGTGLARGALVGLPTLAGKALQYTSEPGQATYEAGRGWVQSAEARGQQPWLTPQPESHGAVTNALAQGAEMVAPALAPVAALAAPVALAGVAGPSAVLAGSIGAGALFGASAGQETLDKAQAAGVNPDEAKTAARLNAAQTVATQVGLGMVGGQMLGAAGTALSRLAGRSAAPLAADVLGDLTGSSGALKPFLKQLPASVGEGVALNAAQAAGTAAIEKNYGIDNNSPGQAALDSIAPSLGMMAVLSPMGLVGHALQARAAQQRTAVLAHPETPANLRSELADQYAVALAKADPTAAQAFRANAAKAIADKSVLPTDPSVLAQPAPPAPPQPEAPAPLALAHNPTPLVVFPDGTVGTHADVDKYVAGLPEDQQVAARAKLMGMGAQAANEPAPATAAPAARATYISPAAQEMHGQIVSVLQAAGIEPTQPMDRKQFALFQSTENPELKGQALARAYTDYLTDPATRKALMMADSDKYQALVAREREPVAPAEWQPPAVPEAPPLAPEARAAQEDAAFTQHTAAQAETAARDTERLAAVARGERAAEQADATALADQGAAERASLDQRTAEDVQYQRDADALRALGVQPLPMVLDTPEHRAEVMAANAQRLAELRPAEEAKPTGQPAIDNRPSAPAEPAPFNPALAEGLASVKAAMTAPDRVRSADEIVTDWKAASEAAGLDTRAQSLVPFQKRIDALGLDKMATHEEQIGALYKLLADDKTRMSDGARSRVQALADAWRERFPAEPRERPVEVANGVEHPDVPPPEPVAALPDKALPEATTTSVASTGTAAWMRTAREEARRQLADYAKRLGGDQGMTPVERQHMQALQVIEGGIATTDPSRMSRELMRHIERELTRQPGTLLHEKRGPIMDDPLARDPALLAPAMMSHRVQDVLDHMAEHGSAPWVKDLAGRLRELNLPTKIYMAPGEHAEGPLVAGEYLRDKDAIQIYSAGTSEHTVLHETTHAATAARIDRAEAMFYGPKGERPRTQDEARLLKAYTELNGLYKAVVGAVKADDLAGEHSYGLTNLHEFIAELNSNPNFQSLLRETKVPGSPKTLWQRVVEGVRKLLGLPSGENTVSALDRAMAIQDPFFGGRREVAEAPALFDKSPRGAAEATDVVLRHVVADTDNKVNRMPWDRMVPNMLKTVLPLQTVEFMAQRARALPAMVKSGFSAGVDAYVAAHGRRDLAARALDDLGSRYVHSVDKLLRAAGKASPALELEMQTIAGEASRGGFDYRLNGRDNLTTNPDLTIDKASMDDIHRRFTQLQRTQPELANAIERGEMVNRKQLVSIVSTLTSNLMESAARAHARIAKDLAGLTPADKNYAEVAHRAQMAGGDSLVAATHAAGLDFLDPTLKAGRNPDPTRWHDVEAANLAGRLDAAFAAAQKLPVGSNLRDSLAQLEQLYRAQAKAPYFSLGRDGDYFVKVAFKGVDAATQGRIEQALQGTNKVIGNLVGKDDYAFFRVASRDQAQGLHDKLVRAGQGAVVDTAWGHLLDRNDQPKAGLANVVRGLQDALEQAVGMDPSLDPAQGALMRDAMLRQVMHLLPETAARSAATPRKGVPGYDGNFVRSFARRASGTVQDTSNAYANRAFGDAARMRLDAIDALNRSSEPDSGDARVRAAMVHDEITKRYQNGLKLVDNDVINQITSFGHSFYLGFSPAYYIRNMAQPWHRGLPVLGSRYGFATSAAEIFRATPAAIKVVTNTIKAGLAEDGWRGILGQNPVFDGLGLSKGEQAFLQEMHDRGVLGLGQAHQLQRMVASDNQRLQDAIKFTSMSAQMSELSNRVALGLAAYRLAEKGDKRLLGKETPTDYAIRATSLAMDNYDPFNTSRAISKHGALGQITPLMAQFQNYNLQTMQQIVRTVQDGLFGQDKSVAGLQRAKEARRELGGLMATTATISGALGLPFANAFAGVYNMLMSDPDDPKDIRISAKNWLTSVLGKDFGEIVAHGLPRVANFDSSTFGLQSVLPGSDFLANRAVWKDRIEQQSQQMMGPALNAGLDLIGGMGKVLDGDYIKGIEQMLPTGLKAPYKAAELATLGYTDSKGNPIALQATPWSVLMQAAGFQTAEKADQGMAARDFSQSQALLQQRRAQINDRLYKSLMLGRGDSGDALSALVAFDGKNPMQPITNVGANLNQHLMRLALASASGAGVGTTKRLLPKLMDDERFAAMPRN